MMILILKKFFEPSHTGEALSTLKIQNVHTKLLQQKYLKVLNTRIHINPHRKVINKKQRRQKRGT